MEKFVSFVLSGSGPRFYVFIGALRVLFTAGYRPKQIIGTSGGGLVGLFLSAHYDPERPMRVIELLEDFAFSFRLKDMLDFGWMPRWPRYWHGIHRGDAVLAMLKKVLPRSWKDMQIPVYVVTSDRNADAVKVWGEADGIEPALAGRGTMSIPRLFDATLIQGHYHTDGGTRANYPLDFFGDEDTIGLRFRPLSTQNLIPPGQQAPAVQSFANGVEFDLDNIDDMIEATSRMHMAAATKARTIMLDAPKGGGLLDFDIDIDDIKVMIQAGERSAQKWLASKEGGGLAVRVIRP